MWSDSKKTGVVLGLTTVFYLLLVWMLQKELLWNLWVINLTWLPYFYLVFVGVKNFSAENPEAAFRDLVREGFIVYLIAQIMYYLFYYLLFFQIDPALLELQAEIELEMLQDARGILGEERADEMRRNLEEGQAGLTMGSLFRQFVPSLLPGFAMAAVFALFVKKGEF
jgi:hypothetical protein